MKKNPLAWVNVALLAILILALNFIGSQEFTKRDLTEEQRYTISERTINILNSKRVQEHPRADDASPIRVIFAFQRNTRNYPRMYSLLEDYKKHSSGKIVTEVFDPLRQPHRAREISQIYGVDFTQNLAVIDARKNPSIAMNTFEERSDRKHVRIRPGASFIKYKTLPDMTKRAVALMMDEVLSSAIVEAVEGDMRKMYVVEGKGGVSRDDKVLLELLEEITASLNIQLSWINLSVIDRLPEDAEGLFIIAPQTDFTEQEMKVVRDFWERTGKHSLFVALDPVHTELPRFYRFIREQGIRPNRDRVLLSNRNRAYYNITAIFPESLNATRSFWHRSTNLEGQSMSFTLEHADENIASVQKLNTYEILQSSPDYYGETKKDLTPKFDPEEDFKGPLCLAAAVTRGSHNDSNNLSTMIVLGNTNLLTKEGGKREQRDYIRTLAAWMSDRAEYAGTSTNEDLTMRIDLNRRSQSFLEYLTLLGMPLTSLLIALLIWNIRRH